MRLPDWLRRDRPEPVLEHTYRVRHPQHWTNPAGSAPDVIAQAINLAAAWGREGRVVEAMAHVDKRGLLHVVEMRGVLPS